MDNRSAGTYYRQIHCTLWEVHLMLYLHLNGTVDLPPIKHATLFVAGTRTGAGLTENKYHYSGWTACGNPKQCLLLIHKPCLTMRCCLFWFPTTIVHIIADGGVVRRLRITSKVMNRRARLSIGLTHSTVYTSCVGEHLPDENISCEKMCIRCRL